MSNRPYDAPPPLPWWKSTGFIIGVCVTLVAAMAVAVTLVLTSTPDGRSGDDAAGQSSSLASEPDENQGTEPASGAPSSGGPPTTSTWEDGEAPNGASDEALCAKAPEATATAISTDPDWGVDYGEAVIIATALLGDLGYGPGASQKFTVVHADATIDFQNDHDLTADGVIGDQTWPVLIEAACG